MRKLLSHWRFFGFVLLVLTIAWQFHTIQYQADYRSWQLCQNTNSGRAAIRSGFNAYNDAFGAAVARDPTVKTPAQQMQQAAALKAFVEDVNRRLEPLHPLPCGPKP